jgi:ubiquinone/menaquinone biosynthesis C-methylase UbiE
VPDVVGPDPQYDVFADEFLDHARQGFYNAHYDRPACLELLGDVAGRTVLDVACGPGLCSEHLVARGAQVIGLDQSACMVELCRQRIPAGDFHVHDLAAPIDWLPDNSVDLVLFAAGAGIRRRQDIGPTGVATGASTRRSTRVVQATSDG